MIAFAVNELNPCVGNPEASAVTYVVKCKADGARHLCRDSKCVDASPLVLLR